MTEAQRIQLLAIADKIAAVAREFDALWKQLPKDTQAILEDIPGLDFDAVTASEIRDVANGEAVEFV